MEILQFTADWCGPCKAMKPRVQSFAEEMGDRITLTVINVDTEKELTERYSVNNVPTFIFKQNDEVVKRLVGAQSIAKFKEIVTEYESKN
jgi:thioredoxin 1